MGDLVLREQGGGYLVQHRLEGVVVVSIDQHDVGLGVGKLAGRADAAEPAAENENSRLGAHIRHVDDANRDPPTVSSPETGDAPLRSAGRLSEMSDQPEPGDDQREISDLIGVQITLAFMVWLLVMLAAFFFVGAVAGVILIFAGVIGFGWYGFSVIRRADQS